MRASFLLTAISVGLGLGQGRALAQVPSGSLAQARAFYADEQPYRAARFAFQAIQQGEGSPGQAYSWVTLSLIHLGLENAASYFFIRTLQSGDNDAIRRVLTRTEWVLSRLGGDVLRKYLIRHTRYEDYDTQNRGAYLFSLGKEALLMGDEQRAVGYLSGITATSPLRPFAHQLRATAYAIQGNTAAALQDFRACQSQADRILGYRGESERRLLQAEREADDLRSRCLAGEARTLYQAGQFEQADRTYDKIAKESFVWPDILFEQAWNAFARREYNRSLGKLVSYKSPALEFVHNSEIEVLRAQSYLALCLYGYANEAVNDFNRRYGKLGLEVKHFVESQSQNLGAFYQSGKTALKDRLSSSRELHRLMNRFVRGPYFQNLVSEEWEIQQEIAASRRLAVDPAISELKVGGGLSGFLEQVLAWRMNSVRALGGAFIKNSLLDYHQELIANFEKVAFIKLEMLGRAKEQLLRKSMGAGGARDVGTVEPSRRDDQYLWSFNGEFWNDELGDYVFGLESACATP